MWPYKSLCTKPHVFSIGFETNSSSFMQQEQRIKKKKSKYTFGLDELIDWYREGSFARTEYLKAHQCPLSTTFSAFYHTFYSGIYSLWTRKLSRKWCNFISKLLSFNASSVHNFFSYAENTTNEGKSNER